jgi:hypothetical protein
MKIRNHELHEDIEIIGYIMGSMRATLDAKIEDSEKVSRLDTLQKEIEFALLTE